LINDILDLSKIESGSFCLEEVDFDLTTLIEQVIEILTPKAESKAISLRAQLGFVAAPTVVGDPVRLQQILLNLLGNAIKFTDQGEVVLRVQCHADESFATVEFAVSDTGIGIPANKLETIFDDFEQAETSTTRRFGGTGLGLGISRRLVRRMRGEIHAESELGKGSTFSFSLILPVGTSQKPLEHSQMDDIEGKQVLIVDPSAVNRVILSEMCSAWGMGVTNCSTGTEALELLRTSGQPQRFALALLDRTMPGLDGFETAEQMQCVDPGIAIFIVSSDSQAGDVARCRELGLAGHLMKPVRRAELLEQVVRALSRRSEADATRVTVLSAEHQAVARRYRILAAEDSEDNRFLLHVYCEGSIYDLTFVEDGERAVAAYQGQQFDLIVMDIQMPVMDGLTATRTIRALERTSGVKRIPILALTANALPEDVSRARDAGCDAHLSKPISKKNFLAGMEQWLAKSAPAVPEPALAAPEAPLVHIEIPEGFEQLSPRYLASRQKELPLLRELLDRSDFDTLRRLSHNMKGTGTSYGFPDISRLGAALEQAAKAGNESDFAQQITKLAAYIEAANVQLHDLVQTNSGD
jgi:CheY-like chemotaxis protein